MTGGQGLFQATVKSSEFILSTLGSHWRAKRKHATQGFQKIFLVPWWKMDKVGTAEYKKAS